MSVARGKHVIDLCEDEDDLDSTTSRMAVTSTAHQIHHSSTSPLHLPPNQMARMARQLGVSTDRLRVGRVSRMLVPKGRGGAVLRLSRNGELQTQRMCPSLNTWVSSVSHPGGPAPHQGLDPGDLVVISDSEDDLQDPRPPLPSPSQAILVSETDSCPPGTDDEDLDATNIVPSPRLETTTPKLRPLVTFLLSCPTAPDHNYPAPSLEVPSLTQSKCPVTRTILCQTGRPSHFGDMLRSDPPLANISSPYSRDLAALQTHKAVQDQVTSAYLDSICESPAREQPIPPSPPSEPMSEASQSRPPRQHLPKSGEDQRRRWEEEILRLHRRDLIVRARRDELLPRILGTELKGKNKKSSKKR